MPLDLQSPHKTKNEREIEKLHEMFMKNILKNGPIEKSDFPVVPAKDVPTSGNYPVYYPGRDNAKMYEQVNADNMKNNISLLLTVLILISIFIFSISKIVKNNNKFQKIDEKSCN